LCTDSETDDLPFCGTGNKSQQSDLSKIVNLIMERNYDPVIIFSFSKR
jgi:ATP-dependent RNA helicase DOB1